jgi:hypothetical protein
MLFARLIHCGWSNHKENEQNICTVDTQKESATLTYLLRTIRLRATQCCLCYRMALMYFDCHQNTELNRRAAKTATFCCCCWHKKCTLVVCH